MKALLICPAERLPVIHLSEINPLVLNDICGKPFLFYWMEHLAAKGVTHLTVLATDRPEMVRSAVERGERWGIEIEVLPERKELAIHEARSRYQLSGELLDIFVADHLPSHPEVQVFSRYAAFFQSTQVVLKNPLSPDRIGLQERSPGVWVGMHCRIPESARLSAPCWIGDSVFLGENVEIGPGAIIENRSIVEDNAHVSHSLVAAETLVGNGTELKHSIVAGNNLINWKANSSIRIDDPHLLMPLSNTRQSSGTNLLGRAAALVCLIVTAPLAFLWVLISNLRNQTVLRELKAVNPFAVSPAVRTISYFEFANSNGLWQRWPQLWNVVRGEFAWVGNRPLNVIEASQLTHEFEKLWFKAPIGLVSCADAEGCFEKLSDESRVHSCYYATQASRRLDLSILWRVVLGCGKRNVTAPIALPAGVGKADRLPLRETIIR